MIESTIFAVLMAAQAPSSDAVPKSTSLTEQNKAVIRCSAAFALVAARQDQGDEEAQKWPSLNERGREFFVVGLANIMDQHGLDRFEVAKLVREESRRINASGEVDQIMPACLLMLESSGL